ncbi:MAG: AMP-binding protein [Actinobacteria bacterium]|nr:AMP-binding protein [Actinomycetota bacterium]
MGHVSKWAAEDPDRPAVILEPSGTRITFKQLDESSNRLAHFLRDASLGIGDHFSLLAENHPRYLEVATAGERTGLYYTPVNSHLTPDEVAYILQNSHSRVLVTTSKLRSVAEAAAATAGCVEHILDLDDNYDDALSKFPTTPIADERLGMGMFYSSGTTGQPKGIKRPIPNLPPDADIPQEAMLNVLYGVAEGDVYLSPAPLYHTAPLGFSQVLLRMGLTIVVLERWDAELALRAIQDHGVTFAQFVPTMFVRLLKLPTETREKYDLSSLRMAVHAAAPCPVPVKQQMIDWWGPIIAEYYGGTEGNGLTYLTAEEWLKHPGSVGKPLLGRPVILDEDGNEVPTGEVGTVYFADGPDFEYHEDPAKTAAAGVGTGRSTLGDVGYVDDEGYLFLTDRKAHMIIAGGANIYPQEVENVLVMHPAVADVAVFGVPDEDMGEQVKAVVEVAAGVTPGPELEAELIAYARERIAHYKCPKSVDFTDALPRLDTGKLYKQKLKEQYW